MVALDYLLYDNRTTAPRIGRDWGVKIATGVLAGLTELGELFEHYCCQLCGDHAYVSGFGEAMGGIRPRNDAGYLLCITVETPDLIGRRSWATYGLWCPDAETLAAALASDPIGAVRQALRGPFPPRFVLLPSATAAPVRGTIAVSRPLVRRFVREESVAQARALLTEALARQRDLPSILGVTASSRLDVLKDEFDVVYSHPLDDRAASALEEHETDDDATVVIDETSAPSAPVSEDRPPAHVAAWLAALSIVAVVLLIPHHWIADGSDDTFELRARLRDIRTLDPMDLELVGRRRNDAKLRDACATLIAQRGRVIAATRAPHPSPSNLARALEHEPVPGRACGVLQLAYPADFKNPQSTARRWCDALTRLARTAEALRARDARSLATPTKAAPYTNKPAERTPGS